MNDDGLKYDGLEFNQFKTKMQEENKKESMYKLSKKQIAKVSLKVALATVLISDATICFFKYGQNVFQRMEGTQYISDKIVESGILPREFSVFYLEDGVMLQYKDANGQVQHVTGESIDDLLDEILETALANGIPADWVAIYLDNLYHYSTEFEGVTKDSMKHAKEVAYEMMQYDKIKEESEVKGAKR